MNPVAKPSPFVASFSLSTCNELEEKVHVFTCSRLPIIGFILIAIGTAFCIYSHHNIIAEVGGGVLLTLFIWTIYTKRRTNHLNQLFQKIIKEPFLELAGENPKLLNEISGYLEKKRFQANDRMIAYRILNYLGEKARLEVLEEELNAYNLFMVASKNEEQAIALIHKGQKCDILLSSGEHLLHLALSKGYLKLAETIIEKDVHFDCKNTQGKTPLLMAVELECESLVALLLSKGADPHIVDLEGNTPLNAGLFSANPRIAALFSKDEKSDAMKKFKERRSLRLVNDEDGEFDRLHKNQKISFLMQSAADFLYLRKKLNAYGHSLEIWETFKRDYYVINHGQATPLMIVNMFVKELLRHLPKDSSHLRHPLLLGTKKNSLHFEEMCENDHLFSHDLLSGDATLNNTHYAESALFFFAKNTCSGVKHAPKVAETILRSILLIEFPHKAEEILKKLNLLISSINFIDEGNLYTICIPKKKFTEIGYLSEPFGRKTLNYTSKDERNRETHKKMALMQEGASFSQVRLVASQLTKANGVKIFLNSTISKERRREIKKEIRAIIAEARM